MNHSITITKTITITECETGWTRFGDNCYKSLGTDLGMGMAQDMCMEEDSNVFFPQSVEELLWIKTMLGTKKVQLQNYFYEKTENYFRSTSGSRATKTASSTTWTTRRTSASGSSHVSLLSTFILDNFGNDTQ